MIAAIRSVRTLARYWKLTAISAFSLSIAMALGVLGLSISNTVLILPPAAPSPDRLVTIYSRSPGNAIDISVSASSPAELSIPPTARTANRWW